jgi:hypothetical protein
LSAADIAETDAWLKKLSSTPPKPEHMLLQGSPWGALYELATSSKLAAGCPFNLTLSPQTRPWVELHKAGTFSAETLDAVPQSFEVGPMWVEKLLASKAAGHNTWLHNLYLGTAFLEAGKQTCKKLSPMVLLPSFLVSLLRLC